MSMPSRKYTAAGSGYRYGFNGKELDTDMDGNCYDYGFRIYNPALGRFLSVDPLTAKFTWLTPYQFAANTPLQAVDLDGKEAFFIHGTNSNRDRWLYPDNGTKEKDYTLMKGLFAISNSNYVDASFNWIRLVPYTHTTNHYIFGNGARPLNYIANNASDREVAAQDLVKHVMNVRKEKGIDKYDDRGNIIEYGKEQITLIGHSHGGNVSIQAAKMIFENYGLQSDIITIETPAYNDKKGKENPNIPAVRKHLHIYNNIDGVQGFAGEDTYHGQAKTNNIPLNVSKIYKFYDLVPAHSFDNVHMKEFIEMLYKEPSATLRDNERIYDDGHFEEEVVVKSINYFKRKI